MIVGQAGNHHLAPSYQNNFPHPSYSFSMIVPSHISRRDYSDSTWSTSGGARWAFFAIFLALVIIVVVGTMRVNKKRALRGGQPIYGTRWMTPPSYFQSQSQYNQPSGHRQNPDEPSTYVPTYTATANEYDMGYYDNQGNFHANPNAKSGQGPQVPPAAHHHTASFSNGQPLSSLNENTHVVTDEHNTGDDLYRAPAGPPPARTEPFQSPEGPPPGVARTETFESPAGPPPGVTEGLSRLVTSSSSDDRVNSKGKA